MAIKAIVQSLDGIPEALKQEYKPIEGGQGFALDVDGVEEHPRVGALKRAKEREATEASSFKKALQEATEKLAALNGEHEKLSKEFEDRLRATVGTKEEDLQRLDVKWGEKLKKANEEAAAKISQRDSALTKVLVMDQARAIVANMNPAEPEYVDVILPHVVRRLQVELTTDGARTRVLDADGKPSADTVQELTEHFKVDKRFAPLLTGSKATGGSANGGNAAGSGSATSAKIDLTKASLAEKVAHYEAMAKLGQ
jgi:DNA polymerase III gamma/tau subunit